MFFGWGRRSRQFPGTAEQALVCSWRYVHLWWFFKVAFGREYFLVGDERSQDRQLDTREVLALHPADVPGPGLWESYGLLIGIAALVVVGLLSSLLSGGGTT